MTNIKILDCTLRDGGYVNNWNFKEKNIKFIVNNLVNAGCDYIECGFLKQADYNPDKSWFQSFEQLEKLLPQQSDSEFTLMINFGEIPLDFIPVCSTKVNLRIVFKKDKRYDAIKYCKQLIEKGYKIFINPMNTNTYSSSELLELIEFVNKLRPVGFTIVDTTGAMNKKDILSTYYLVENNLDKSIALCFHSHNNLQLSFSNAQVLMEQNTKRKIIIDSTVFGIGRGAGNLCTELLVKYINDNYDGKYNIIPILKIIDEQINKIFAVSPWGYSVPYYMAAANFCHPNYAKFLIDKQTVPVELINKILNNIPYQKRGTYDEALINDLYRRTLEYFVDDSSDLQKLSLLLLNKPILLLASGKSIVMEEQSIKNYIHVNKPFIISLNFIPKQYSPDLVFVTNIKRYNNIEGLNIPCATTSNIKNPTDYKLNYSSYVTDKEVGDNVTLILLQVLLKIGVKEVAIAGFDGYSNDTIDNYAENELINIALSHNTTDKNRRISEYLNNLRDYIKLNFVTHSWYEVEFSCG